MEQPHTISNPHAVLGLLPTAYWLCSGASACLVQDVVQVHALKTVTIVREGIVAGSLPSALPIHKSSLDIEEADSNSDFSVSAAYPVEATAVQHERNEVNYPC